MAITTSSVSGAFEMARVEDTAVSSTAIKDKFNGAATLRQIVVDNTTGGASAVHFKLYDNANPTIGGTAPVMVIPVAASKKYTVNIKGGYRFGTAVSYACVQEAGTAGTTAPAATVKCYLEAYT